MLLFGEYNKSFKETGMDKIADTVTNELEKRMRELAIKKIKNMYK